MRREMVGKRYKHSKLGVVEVIAQPNYEAGKLSNVMVKTIKGRLIIVPQRSLRKLKEHKARHKELHNYFDELVADFITETGKLPSKATILELMEWSYSQTINPTGKWEGD